jgi:type II secretory pathway component PulF
MLRNIIIKQHFGGATRIRTWRKLSMYLRYNISDLEALETLRARYDTRGHILADLFAAIIDDLNKGQSLDKALAPWVPVEEIMLIRGGLKGNRISEALTDCVTLIENRQKIISGLISAVTYPLLLGVLFIMSFLVMAFYIIPELSMLSNPETWHGMAAALYHTSTFMSSFLGLFSLAALLVVFSASLLSLPFWTGSLRVYFDKIPPWSIYRLIVGSIWMSTVATLLRANMQLDQILSDMLENDILRPWLRERVQLIKDHYQIEANFGTLLLQLNLNFPDQELVEDLAVYANFPEFHKNLYSIAMDWLNEGTERIQNQAKRLNAILFLGIVFILCCFGLAISSMQSQVMGGF